LRKIIAFILVELVFGVIRIILRFVFYKIIVKAYQAYFSLIKKLGWSDFRNSPMLFLIRQKLVHITVLFVTALLVFTNLTATAKGVGAADIGSQTMLASLVNSEFSNSDQPQTLEEFFDTGPATPPAQEKYLDNSSVVKSEPILNTKSANNNQENAGEASLVGPSITGDGTALVRQDTILTVKTKRARPGIVYYTVQPGDVIGQIADQFDLKVSTILWENSLTAYSIIRPGDRLTILPMDGIIYQVTKGDTLEKIANKYNVDKNNIAEANKLDITKALAAGQKIFVPGGTKIQASIARTPTVAARTAVSGLQVLKDLILPKAPSAAPASRGKLNWPTIGYRITQYYSWRHQAVDIANKIGTPLYAADDGVVEIAGWGTGYGNTILINHGNGMKTRYGHLSQFFVKAGDEVVKGETIGLMGSTGWSTGPHVHFEVIINGVKYNPLNYLAR